MMVTPELTIPKDTSFEGIPQGGITGLLENQ
jgi:hypothetical protein